MLSEQTIEMLFGYWNNIQAFVLFFLGFSFLIFIHELGHFLVARWVGIKCTQFAVGMGHAVCSWRKGLGLRRGGTEPEYWQRIEEQLRKEGIEPKQTDDPEKRFAHEDVNRANETLGLGETEYRINYLPLGGYVKMLGQEDMDPAARSNDPRSFNSKSVGARMAVISAGVIMNMILGVILLTWAFTVGVEFPSTTVGAVEPGRPAATTYAVGHDGEAAYQGLKVNDTLRAINGKPVRDFIDVKLGVALSNPDTPLKIHVERPGETELLIYEMTPTVSGIDSLLSLGILPIDTLEIEKGSEKLPAGQVGVQPGMRLAKVNDQAVTDYADYYIAMMQQPNQPATLEFVNDENGETLLYTTAARPQLIETKGNDKQLLGFKPAVEVHQIAEKNNPADKAGLKPGDIIARIGDTQWPTADSLLQTLADSDGQPIDLAVLRDGEYVSLGTVKPEDKKIGFERKDALGLPIIAGTLADSPAAALNLPAGSRLTSLNGKPIRNWADIRTTLEKAEPGDLQATFKVGIHDQPSEEATIHVDETELAAIQKLGWNMPNQYPYNFIFEQRQVTLKGDSLIAATTLGFEKTADFMTQAYLMIARLVQRTVKPKHLSGPVGIVHAGTSFTKKGFSYALYFLGLLSVNLAVINFLPIPIVDGGHAVFLIVEKIKGSPVSANVQAAATYVGLAFLALVFVVVTFYDVARLIS